MSTGSDNSSGRVPCSEIETEAQQAAAPDDTNPTLKLTVSTLSKVDKEFPTHKEASYAPSKWLTVAKWLGGILLSLAFTVCLVFSKVGIILLCQGLSDQGPSDPEDTPEATLAMIIIAFLIPLAIRLMRGLWAGGFSADQPWPGWKALTAGILASVLDSLGLALFVLGVLPNTSPSTGVTLMNGVFFVQASFQTFRFFYMSSESGARVRRASQAHIVSEEDNVDHPQSPIHNQHFVQGCQKYGLPLTLVLSVLLSLAGIIMIMSCTPGDGILMQTVAIWAIPVSLVCLSVAWCSPLQRQQSLPKEVNGRSPLCKVSIINCVLRMLLLPGLLILFSYTFHPEINLTSLSDGFTKITPGNPLFLYFILTVVCSFAGYLFGWLACTMSMQRLAFALPITLATPIAFILVIYCEIFPGTSDCSLEHNWSIEISSVACLYLAKLLSTGYFIFKGSLIVMEKESQLFWVHGYNGAFLGQYMLLNRKTEQTDATQVDRLNTARSSRVFICTTMYRESPHEMEQLLRSLGRINKAKQQSDRHVQAHIVFDNGVRSERLTQFALQLVDKAATILAPEGFDLNACNKIRTPYGMKLRWKLGKKGMVFVIHLKDNLLVKSKKRWSQVMYMSYVLDFIPTDDTQTGATDNNTFILTTDGDVSFTPSSVQALLNHMARDDKVGAVCARTYPIGSGPVVWYQIFDYAIGHWFQKAANHVFGSVLCCPGCFSVYRVGALRNVLPEYASSVTRASEFLTKDMGEDRWLCTLLVQSGWRLEYSAAADNYTYCPEEFDEFFKQRRRWVPSTLANLALLLQEWLTVYYFNNKISLLFLFYQAILFFSTLISPAVCILVVSGGVYYAWGISQYVTVTLMCIMSCGFAAVCLYASPNMQLKVAKVITVVGAFVMAAVAIGTAVQITGEHLSTNNPTQLNSLVHLPMSISSLYLLIMISMFVVAALLHLPEAYCLLHGVWYLLCLPAGFIILLTYSIVNLTDRSWGTREEKTIPLSGGKSGTHGIIQKLKKLFNCCLPGEEQRENATKCTQTSMGNDNDDTNETPGAADGVRRPCSERSPSVYLSDRSGNISDWLPENLKEQYGRMLESNGYDDTSFLIGMTDTELKTLGVKQSAHRHALLAEIRTLGEPEIPAGVPESVQEWLGAIGLSKYEDDFKQNNILTVQHLEILKTMSQEDIKKDIHISKPGHLKRLAIGIKYLRYPTESEKSQRKVRAKLEELETKKLNVVKEAENTFWEDLKRETLRPTQSAFSDDYELKEQLTELRNSVLLVFGVANTLWIILILTLAPKSQLNVLDTNPLGLSFLIVFGLVLTIQFVAMVIHRLSTFIHLIARAPPKFGDPYNINWSWMDNSASVSSPDHPGSRNGDDYTEEQV